MPVALKRNAPKRTVDQVGDDVANAPPADSLTVPRIFGQRVQLRGEIGADRPEQTTCVDDANRFQPHRVHA